MIRQAQVVESAQAGGFVNVVLQNVSQCRQCASGNGCGALLFSGSGKANDATLRCRSEISVLEGQTVLVDIDDHGSQWLWPVFGAFGLPLAGMLLASVFASFLMSAHAGPGLLHNLSGYSAVMEILAAAGGLAAGIRLWQSLEPAVLARINSGLCFESARIVSTKPNL